MKDTYEYMNGTYLGKDMSLLPFLLDLYKIKDKKLYVDIITTIDKEQVLLASNKQQQKASLEEAQAKAKVAGG